MNQFNVQFLLPAWNAYMCTLDRFVYLYFVETLLNVTTATIIFGKAVDLPLFANPIDFATSKV